MILRAQNPGLLNCECVCVHVDLSGAEGKWFGGGGGGRRKKLGIGTQDLSSSS
jgi:hypothetical protein